MCSSTVTPIIIISPSFASKIVLIFFLIRSECGSVKMRSRGESIFNLARLSAIFGPMPEN